MARSFFQVRKRIYWLLARKDMVCYLWGAKGKLDANGYPQPYTEAEIRAIIANDEEGYFTRNYTASDREEIVQNSKNRYCFDCSGLVCFLTGETGYSREIYAKRTIEWSQNDAPECAFIFTDYDNPSKRHIFLDAGQGYTIQVCKESCSKNRNTSHGDKTGLLLQTYDEWFKMWDKHTLHIFGTAAVNYNGAIANDPNAGPKPVPPAPVDKVGRVVNCSAVNLRQGPTTACDVCTVNLGDGKGWRHVLYAGETVKVIAEENGWYEVELKGLGYTWLPWVKGTYLKIE